jgi:hypothetical protein
MASSLPKTNLPSDTSANVAEAAQACSSHPVNDCPNLVEILNEHVMKPGPDYGDQFEYGLDVILDDLERIAGGT